MATVDAVLIRKSSSGQDEKPQIGSVRRLLEAIDVTVPEQYWFVCTVSRDDVQSDKGFKRLKDLISNGRIGRIYIESQDRFGTDGPGELFVLLEFLRDNDTELYDLQNKCDLTEKDDLTEMRAFMGSMKSKKEVHDTSRRSTRSRAINFRDSGTWPTGIQPFGYAKRCFSEDGNTLLWEWQPETRILGQIFFAQGNKLTPGPKGVKIPRKEKKQKTYLTPSKNKEHVRTVQLVFSLFTQSGLSRRQISAHLNKLGRKFYESEFTHPLVTQILTNPAYVGDIHYGKTQTGKYHTFNSVGTAVSLKKKTGRAVKRDAPLKREGVHKGLIDRRTWKMAQNRLRDEASRTSYAPRNDAYYLKPIFVCGHCGKNLTGRTEIDPSTKQRRVAYFCSTYIAGKSSGRNVSCQAYRITHAQAEKMLLDKLSEKKIDYDAISNANIRDSLEQKLRHMGHEDNESLEQWTTWLREGVEAFIRYVKQSVKLKPGHIERLRFLAEEMYWDRKMTPSYFEGLPITLGKFKTALEEAEAEVATEAGNKLTELTALHVKYTLAWAEATDGLQKTVLKQKADELSGELAEWQSRSKPLGVRLRALFDAEGERQEEEKRLRKEWPALQNREKGEALRRIFKTVTLFWSTTFRDAEAKPYRPRKTDRPGRNSYTLETAKTVWAFEQANLGTTP